MKHARVSGAWRAGQDYGDRRSSSGVLTAFVFNVCLLVLPLASAFAVLVIGRDHLYAYEYSEAGARAIGNRVAKMNADLIQLDFDRVRQWDDLVAMELMAGDIPAARGFLLSGGQMLPSRYGGAINRAAARGDAAAELAALEILTPGTRGRYESTVPLLSRRAANTTAQALSAGVAIPIGDRQDFELMARNLLAEPNTDATQFILTGLTLGLAGDFSRAANDGASALLAASRRPDYQPDFAEQMHALINHAVPIEDFRRAALASAPADEAGAFANAAAAFRAAANGQRVAQVRGALEEIGGMSQAISASAATDLVTHATALRDLPRLRLIAQAAGDRAAAAAKRLPRDGELLRAARGDLTVTRELAIALALMGLALAALIGIVAWKGYTAGRRMFFAQIDDDDYSDRGDLVDIGASNWRPL
jgi:hypothetical protein